MCNVDDHVGGSDNGLSWFVECLFISTKDSSSLLVLFKLDITKILQGLTKDVALGFSSKVGDAAYLITIPVELHIHHFYMYRANQFQRKKLIPRAIIHYQYGIRIRLLDMKTH